MPLPQFCAFNQSRESFISLEVKVVDSPLTLQEFTPAGWDLDASEGVWITRLDCIPANGFPQLLDIVLLDAQCKVVRVVDSSPGSCPSWDGLAVESALILPLHAVFSTETRAGDQLVICPADEMQRRLEKIANPALEIAGAVMLREKPLWSGGPGVLRLNNRSALPRAQMSVTHEMPLASVEGGALRSPIGWLKKWWTPDPRRAPRVPAPGLAAYYWNGCTPEPHAVRNISSSGLYVVTEERWYPGTLVLMTLQHGESVEQVAERSIAVHTRAVRWDEDGVGLQFVLPDPRSMGQAASDLADGATRRQLDSFLSDLRVKK